MVNRNKFGLAGKCLLIGLPIAVALGGGCQEIRLTNPLNPIDEYICPQPGTSRYEQQKKVIEGDRKRFAKLNQVPKKEKSLAESLLWGGIVGATIDSLKKPKTPYEETKDPNNYSENQSSDYRGNK